MESLEHPLVSVVMPAYNMAEYIAESIESVLASDYAHLELIVVDDGSKDATLQIARQYAERDSRVVALTKSNGGQGRARNFGVEQSRGKYLLLVDSDDLIGRSYISQAVAVMEQNDNVKVVTCRGEFFDGRTGDWKLPDFTLGRLARRNLFMISSMMRRDDFVRVGGFDETMPNYCEDWALWIAILKDGGEVVKLPTVEFYYRVRRGSSRFIGRVHWKDVVATLNRKYPDFFERELGGKLSSQRSMSKILNRTYKLVFPRKVVVAKQYKEYKYYMKALPRVLYYSGNENVVFGNQPVEVTLVRNVASEYARAVKRGDRDVIGYCVERRWQIFKRGWIVRLKR